MHQELEYQDITDDDIYQKNKKKKTKKKEDWSDKPLGDFLETFREQPVKEMNDRRKWIMLSKCLERNKKRDGEALKKGSTISQKPIPQYQALQRKKAHRGTQHRSKRNKKRRASSHLHVHRNSYLQLINWKI